MKTLLRISIILFILLTTTLYSQSVPKKMNFRARDAAWRAKESSPLSNFRVRDREWIKKDVRILGWRKKDIKWRETDARSDSNFRKRDAAWLAEDSR